MSNTDRTLAEQLEDAKVDLAERRKRLAKFEKQKNQNKVELYEASVRAGEANVKALEKQAAEYRKVVEAQIAEAERLIKDLRESVGGEN